MARLDNKVAIVTGASQGMGLAIAQRFVKENAKVVMCDVNSEKGESEAAKLGDNAKFMQLDVSQEDQWQHVFDETIKLFGKVDVVVNDAGITHPDNAENIEMKDWHRVMSVNVDGVMLGTKYGIKHMKDHGGSIINFSSAAGLVGVGDFYAYSTSKGAVTNLTKSAALYCAAQRNNVRVNSVHPGDIKTPLIAEDSGGYEAFEKYEPVGRLGEPSEVANLVLFLASDESSFCTGAPFIVDGGYLAQ